jgi:hypothetical protein
MASEEDEYAHKWCATCSSSLPQLQAQFDKMKRDVILHNQAELEMRLRRERAILFSEISHQRESISKANEHTDASISKRLDELHEKERAVQKMQHDFNAKVAMCTEIDILTKRVNELRQAKAQLTASIDDMQTKTANQIHEANNATRIAYEQLNLLHQRQRESLQYGLYEATKQADGSITLADKGYTWVSLHDLELSSPVEASGNETITGRKFLITKRPNASPALDTGMFEYWCTVGDFTMIAYSKEALF